MVRVYYTMNMVQKQMNASPIFEQLSKCSVKKIETVKFIDYISPFISEKQLELVENCGSFLQFVSDKEFNKTKLYRGSFCKNRYCPFCSWRKSLKDALELSIMLRYIVEKYNFSFLFLTLTAPNVTGENLNDEIKKYNKAFSKLTKRKAFINISKGTVRKLEVTYNKNRKDFHPHLHVMIAVDSSYFTNPAVYLSHEKWLNLWRDVMNDPTITQVDIRRSNVDDFKAISEVTKYVGKSYEYLSSPEVFKDFYESLKGKRLLSYSGIFKDARNLLKRGDLDYLKEKDNTVYEYFLFYRWGISGYDLSQISPISPEEKKKII